MILSLLLVASQIGPIKPNGQVKPPKLGALNVPPPVVLILPLIVQGQASDVPKNVEWLKSGFLFGVLDAEKQPPIKSGECRVLSARAIRDIRAQHPEVRSGTDNAPIWNMKELAKAVTPLGVNYIVLPYMTDYKAGEKDSSYTAKAKGLISMWSAKSGSILLGSAPLGGDYSRPKAQGAYTAYEIAHQIAELELRPVFYEQWGKKKWPSKQ